ncbi:MAG: ATP-binding protein [Thermomicrobiales bacterium]|nr:ATP-binding protein [Thermomicrobiales bacterium]MCO5217843.1 ATP-binding protein [Thermomicrobiales bacterium]MCO5223900.1 ATP-binding protein [Thermomicrobiales bacterium]MCO5227463.1 ATP-binding protein [Thermomicrobiales bacterium]
MRPLNDFLKNHPAVVPFANEPLPVEDETPVCPKCGDKGFLRYDVPADHPSFGQVYECDCRKQQKAVERIDRLRKLSNLSAFTGTSFADFEIVPGTQQALEEAMAFAQDPTQRWLVLSGPVGVGKTHLAVAIAHFVIEQGMNAYFAAVPDLMDHLRSTFAPGSEDAYDDRFEEIRNAQLLVLDDLGTENATPWAQEKLYQIINHRYVERLPTVITTNVDLRKIDDRVASRMLDYRLTTHVDIDATDYRRPGETRTLRRGSGSRRP